MPKPKPRGDWTDALFGITKKSKKGRARPHSAIKVPGLVPECPYCGAMMAVDGPEKSRPTRDHVVPVSLGHSLKDNKIICCFECNQMKANRTLDQWLIVLSKKNDAANINRALRINTIIRQRHRSGLKIDVSIDDHTKCGV